jgi:uncharacterized phage-associated protein
MSIRTKFDTEKAMEAILYIAKRVKTPTFHTISKIFYFADQIHILKYGRFITGDQYIAMKHSPVPSATYDMLKYVRGDQTICHNEHARSLFSIHHKHHIYIQRDADLDEFSDSDIECLDKSIIENGHLSFNELTIKSHDPIYDAAGPDEFIPIEAFIAHLQDKDALQDHLNNPAY